MKRCQADGFAVAARCLQLGETAPVTAIAAWTATAELSAWEAEVLPPVPDRFT